MRVLGVDCGSQVTGYGIVEQAPDRTLQCVAAGAIRLNAKQLLPDRLAQVFRQLSEILQQHAPDAVAIEEVFYAENAKSALKLGHVRGVAMLVAATYNVQ